MAGPWGLVNLRANRTAMRDSRSHWLAAEARPCRMHERERTVLASAHRLSLHVLAGPMDQDSH